MSLQFEYIKLQLRKKKTLNYIVTISVAPMKVMVIFITISFYFNFIFKS